MTASAVGQEGFSDLFAPNEFDGTLEAAFLLKPTGIPVAAWTRAPVSQEIISVMAATLWGSLDTMIRALGGDGPRSAFLEVEDRCILATLIESQWTLLLVAPRSLGKTRLRGEAQRIVERVSVLRRKAGGHRARLDVRE